MSIHPPAQTDSALSHVNRVVSSDGAPLAPTLRAELELRLDTDLSRVRTHTGSDATSSADALRCRAYTYGDHIVFRAGQYRPRTREGRRLIAHEVAHTMQQSRGGDAPSPLLDSGHEREADSVAGAFARGARGIRVGGRTGRGIARDATFLAANYEPNGMTDEQIQTEMAVIRTFLKNPFASDYQSVRARRNLGRLQGVWDTRHPDAAGAQHYNLRLARPPLAPEASENLTRTDAMAVLRKFRGSVDAQLYGAEAGYAEMRKIHDEHRIVGGISDTLGGVSFPPESIFDDPRDALAQGDRAYDVGDVVGAAQAYQRAANTGYAAERRFHDYQEGTIKGAGRSVTGLEVVETAAAATVTIGTGGAAGVLVGAAYGGVQQIARQASEVHYGLRDRIDWAGIGFDTAVGVVTGYLGGKLGNAVLGKLLRNPAVASLGRKVLAEVVSDLVAGRTSAVLHTAARTVFDAARGRGELTYEGFIDRIADQLTDPKGAILDTIMGAAFRRAPGPKASSRSEAAPSRRPDTAAAGSRSAEVPVGGPELALAGGGRSASAPPSPHLMESRMVKTTRETPTKPADLYPPKIHPSKAGGQPAERPKLGEAPFDEPLTPAEKGLSPEQLRQKHILEEQSGRQRAADKGAREEAATGPGRRDVKNPGKSIPVHLERGQFAHEYAELLIPETELPRGLRAEVTAELPGGTVRLDRVSFEHGVYYEIKPNTPGSVAAGAEQIAKYADYMNENYPLPGGRRWTGRVVTYEHQDAIALFGL